MVSIEIRLIIFFAAKDGANVYSQQKQDVDLTVTQIINSLLQKSGSNFKKYRKPLGHLCQVGHKSDTLWLYSGSDKWIQGIRSGRQECLKTYGQEVCNTVQEAVTKTIPKKKKCKKAKWLSEEALKIAVRRREAKEKRKDTPIWMQSSKEQQGDIRKPSSAINTKK